MTQWDHTCTQVTHKSPNSITSHCQTHNPPVRNERHTLGFLAKREIQSVLLTAQDSCAIIAVIVAAPFPDFLVCAV